MGFIKKHLIKIVIALIIVALIIGVGFYQKSKANSLENYVFDTAKIDTVATVITETGNLQAIGQAEVKSSASGVVQNVFIKDDQYVRNGQALFQVKANASDAEVSSALSTYLTAQQAVTTANQTKRTLQATADSANQTLLNAQENLRLITDYIYKGIRNTATNNKYTPAELESAKMSVQIAQNALNTANQNLSEADQSIATAQAAQEAAKLAYEAVLGGITKAPTAGYVSNLSLNIGDSVTAGVTGKTTMLIVKSKNVQFVADVNEIDVVNIKKDQAAQIELDAVKNKTYQAKVAKIDNIGTSNQGVVLYKVYFDITDQDENLKPAMTGSFNLESERRENVLTVANSAVKNYQNGKAVQVIEYVNNQPQVKFIPVKIGLKGTDRTEILEGINENLQIIMNDSKNEFKSNFFGG